MEPRAGTSVGYTPPPRLEMSMTKLPDGTCRYVRVVPTAASQLALALALASGGKQRGRPRKYRRFAAPTAVANPTVTPPEVATLVAEMGSSGHDGFAGGVDPIGTVTPLAAVNASGPRQNGFLPCVVSIKAGQDISKILSSFGQKGHASVLSAHGMVSQVELHRAATSGHTTNYEGHFEILLLSGLLSETGGLRVLLSGPKCEVFGGRLAGILIAASPVQVIMGSFTAEAPWVQSNQCDCVRDSLPKKGKKNSIRNVTT